MSKEAKELVRVLAVASGGGHWVQLMRLHPAWRGCDAAYVTTNESYAGSLHQNAERGGLTPPRFYVTVSANRWQKLRLMRQLLTIAWIVVKVRLAVVCTTGAAPGYFATRVGKLLGARTVWIDSIANAETMSLAGFKAGKHVDLWLTQWQTVAAAEPHDGRRPEYWGAVL